MMKTGLIFSSLVFVSSTALTAPAQQISCFSESESIEIVVNLENCNVIENDRVPSCKAVVKVDNKPIAAVKALMVVKNIQFPQAQVPMLSLVNREMNQKPKTMVAFQGASSQQSPKKFQGEVHVEFKGVNRTEKMSCDDYSSVISSR